MAFGSRRSIVLKRERALQVGQCEEVVVRRRPPYRMIAFFFIIERTRYHFVLLFVFVPERRERERERESLPKIE